jgi:transcriptional regulator
MHPAGAFHETDPQRLAALVAEVGLALIVAATDRRPLVAHAPLVLRGDRVRFHLSAMNAMTPVLAGGARALAVVTGPDAYVSPDWYAAADQVPTWNYISAELEGPVRPLDRDETAALLDDLSARFEAPLAPKPPWTRGKMTPARFEAMLGAIRGFEMVLDRFEGITKLSQNKPVDEAARVAAALARRPDHGSQEIARLMSRQAAAAR